LVSKGYISALVKKEENRIIGKYVGEADGPMLLCLAGMHGNEPAGVRALDLLLKMLEVEPITNPDFKFCGSIIGIRGNLQALATGQRFIDKDLNRSLKKEHVDNVLQQDKETLKAEDLEIYELINTINREIRQIEPKRIVVLDLHTTTAYGGIFTLTSNEEASIRIGVDMHAPVITGFEDVLVGTTMGYFKSENFSGISMAAVVFESGQHEEPLSVNRAIAAIINCMRTIGCVAAEDVENRHDYLLLEYSKNLPKVARLLSRYHVADAETFHMLPDFKNFGPVKKGELLAYENGNEITASQDGFIVMPKYQNQGQDGFFLVEKLEGY
jgi:succinylglutamate desuccinylase